MKILEHNATTDKVIEREATKDELAQIKIDDAERAQQRLKYEADAVAKAALLERLGLTADEMVLLLS